MRISFIGRIQYGQNYRDSPRYNQNSRNDFRRGNFRGNLRSNQNFRGKNYRDGYGRNYRNDNYERGKSGSRERQFSDNASGMTEVVMVDLDQFQELVLIEIGIDVRSVENMIILLKTAQLQK